MYDKSWVCKELDKKNVNRKFWQKSEINFSNTFNR